MRHVAGGFLIGFAVQMLADTIWEGLVVSWLVIAGLAVLHHD